MTTGGALAELSVVLRLKDEMQAGINSATTGLKKVEAGADKAGEAAGLMSGKFGKAATAIAASATAISAGLLVVTGRAREVNSQLDAVAATIGENKEAFRGMAASLVDVTYSYDEVVSVLQEIESHGVKSADTMKALASAADTTADAIQGQGATAKDAANLMLSFAESFDDPIEKAGDLQDALAYAANTGGASMGLLQKAVGRVGNSFDDIGGNAQQFIAIVSQMSLSGMGDKQIMSGLSAAIDAAAGAEQNWKDKVDEATQSQADLTDKIASGQEALANLTDQMNTSRQAISDYNDEIAKQQTTVDELAQAYADSLTNTDEFASAYEGVKNQADSLTSSLEAEQDQLVSLNQSLADAQQAHADLEQQYAAAVKSVQDLTAEYEASISATDIYAAAQEKAKDRLDTLANQYDDVQDRMEDYRGKLVDLDQDEQRIIKDRDKAAQSVADLSDEYQNAINSTDILDEATQKHADQIANLSDEYEKLGDSIERYQDQISDNAHETGNLEKDLSNEQATLAELRAQYDELNNAKNASGGKLYVDPTSMSALADAIADSQGKVDEYSWKIAENKEEQGRLAESLAETEAAQAKNAGAQAKAASDTSWYTTAVQAQDAAVQAIADKLLTAQERYTDLGQSLADNRATYADTASGLSDLGKESETLAGKVATAKSNLAEFGQISIGAVTALTPFQQAAADTATRTEGLATKLADAKNNVSELSKDLSDNEASQTKIQKSIGTTTSTIADYEQQLADVNTEMGRFTSAGLDIVKNSSPFEEAQKRTAANQERALLAYQGSVTELANLNKARDDEIKKLGDYQTEYDKTTKAVDELKNAYIDASAAVLDLYKNMGDTDEMTAFWKEMEKYGISPGTIAASQGAVPANYAESQAGINAQSKGVSDFIATYWDKMEVALGTKLQPLETIAAIIGALSGVVTAGLLLTGGTSGLSALLGGGAAGIAGGLGGAAAGAGAVAVEGVGLGVGAAGAAAAAAEAAGAAALVAEGAATTVELAAIGVGDAGALAAAAMGGAEVTVGTTVATVAGVSATAIGGAILAGIGVGLAGVAALVYSGALEWVKSIGDTFRDKLPGALDMPSIVLAPLGALGIAAVDLVTGKLDRIPADVGEIFYKAWQAAGRQFSGLKTALDEAWKAVETWGKDTFTSIGKVWDSVKTAVGPAWTLIASAVSTEAGKIKTWIMEQANPFALAAGLVWAAIGLAVPLDWAPIGAAVTTAVDGIRTWIGTQTKPFTDEIGKIWANISTMIPPDWSTIKTAVITAVDGVRTWIGTQVKPYTDEVGKIWSGIETGVKPAWDLVTAAVKTAIDGLAAAMDIALGPVKTGLAIVNGVGSAVQGALNLLPGGQQQQPTASAQSSNEAIYAANVGGYATTAMREPKITDAKYGGDGASKAGDRLKWYADWNKWVHAGKYHAGGTFQAPGGNQEGLALLLSGERVLSPAQTSDYDSGLLNAVKQLTAMVQRLGAGGQSKDITVTVESDIPLTVKRIDQFNANASRQQGYRSGI